MIACPDARATASFVQGWVNRVLKSIRVGNCSHDLPTRTYGELATRGQNRATAATV